MRRFGMLLTAIGLLVGLAVSLALIAGVTMPGVPWLVTVGLVKLSYIASVGLIASGAVLRKLAKRAEEEAKRERLPAG
ncbi:MAG: hypothetical protein ACT4OZ_03565 [Gemmatimonadota bacterium]